MTWSIIEDRYFYIFIIFFVKVAHFLLIYLFIFPYLSWSDMNYSTLLAKLKKKKERERESYLRVHPVDGQAGKGGFDIDHHMYLTYLVD